MKSERIKLGHCAGGSWAYEQTEVARYADFHAAVAACDQANRGLTARHYVMNDTGKELYADTWID